MNFNPRSPRGERRQSRGRCGRPLYFNPRSPRGERHMLEGTAVLWEEFQSTLPVRGATKPGIQRIRIKGISIHAPREGSDSETAQRHRYVL